MLPLLGFPGYGVRMSRALVAGDLFAFDPAFARRRFGAGDRLLAFNPAGALLLAYIRGISRLAFRPVLALAILLSRGPIGCGLTLDPSLAVGLDAHAPDAAVAAGHVDAARALDLVLG